MPVGKQQPLADVIVFTAVEEEELMSSVTSEVNDELFEPKLFLKPWPSSFLAQLQPNRNHKSKVCNRHVVSFE